MSQTNLTTEEARQGERKPGMMLVLLSSTLIAAGLLGIGYIIFAAG